MKTNLLQAIVALSLCMSAAAQVNSGSNGSDGVFNPTTNIVINMADHPNGIYQYTSVNISNGVTVTFNPNANNTPVIWLVQSNCVISGSVSVNGINIDSFTWGRSGAPGGPGGFGGGHAPFNNNDFAGTGFGPGGGKVIATNGIYFCGGNGSYGQQGGEDQGYQQPPGNVYGNSFLIPLIGGSGGSGGYSYGYWNGGGGGGGAILIAANGVIQVDGSISAKGGGALGQSQINEIGGGGGSGGAIRFVSQRLTGHGNLDVSGGNSRLFTGAQVRGSTAGSGRIRFDTLDNSFGGSVNGAFTQGYQPIIIQTNGQGAQLTVTSVGGVPVSASPSGQLATPDAVLSAQQSNPVSVVVHCSNIPLNTQITVNVKPANGATVSATGLNSSGTLSSSTATVLITMPRGGGLIYATAAN